MTHSPSYRRILHRMGYYDYQQGLIYHHMNQEGWKAHHDHCRDFIIKAIDLFAPEKISILGSGWLMDLPLKEMSQKADDICLIDIVHPPEVKNQTSEMKNVRLIEEDVSGGLIEEVWKKAGRRTFLNRLHSLDEILIPLYMPVEDPGMVISLNILTQLETLPEKLLRKKTKASDEEFMVFRREIQTKHINFLKNHNSVLISDISEIISGPEKAKSERITAVAEIPSGRLKDEWIWDFDLSGYYFNRKRSVFKVCAVVL
jgi:hypothetical protein